jgi:hypothetical protein
MTSRLGVGKSITFFNSVHYTRSRGTSSNYTTLLQDDEQKLHVKYTSFYINFGEQPGKGMQSIIFHYLTLK